MFEKNFDVAPGLYAQNICFEMQNNPDDTVAVTSTQNDEVLRRLGARGKKNVKKIVTLMTLLTDICVTREKCIEWLKNKGFIPKVLFCPKCNNRMKFEPDDHAVDRYIWICKECTSDPPQLSVRHGSWLENRNYPLRFILLYTYLWAHSFTLEQICKETTLPVNDAEEWNSIYCTICHSLYQRNIRGKDDDPVDGNSLDIDKESAAEIWRKKYQSKDPFLQFLKDADSF